MIQRLRYVTVVAVLLTGSMGVDQARGGSTLGVAGDHGEFVFGDSKRSGLTSASGGAVAVGGNATFSGGFNIATSTLAGSGVNLQVGGDLSWSGTGSIVNGSGVYGGGYSHSGPSHGDLNGGAPTIDFAAVLGGLGVLSNAQYDSSAPVAAWSGKTLALGDASSTGLQVFNAEAGDIPTSGNKTITLNGTADSTVIVNVLGETISMSNTTVILNGGLTANHVLWNFIDATSLKSSGTTTILGTVLAVNAEITLSGASTIYGSLIAGSLGATGTLITHIDSNGADARFTGQLAGAVPEPASVAMLGMAAVVGLGLAARRRARP